MDSHCGAQGRKKGNDPINTPRRTSALRGTDNALQWLCTNTRPDFSADTSISAGTSGPRVPNASIQHAQMLIRTKFMRRSMSKLRSGISIPRLRLAAFHVVGWASRPDGPSQRGWTGGSCKLKRACRFNLCTKCQTMAEAPDNLIFVRMFWEYLLGGRSSQASD